MKALKLSLVVCVAAVLVVNLAALLQQPAFAQGDPFIGTWVLNVAKSKYTPGPPPSSQTSVYEVAGQGVKVTTKGTDAAGKPTSSVFTANYDGKDYPVTGNPDWDTTTVKRVDSHTLEFVRKKAGKVVQTATNVAAKDGKSRTVTATGVNAQGQKINNFVVFEKK